MFDSKVSSPVEAKEEEAPAPPVETRTDDATPRAGEGLRRLARAAKKAKADGLTIPLP